MNDPVCGDCAHYNGRLLCRKLRYTEGEHDIAICIDFERKTMPNIKITAEVDGKQVPLETVSTETFEAIKALEKPKEIPVARVGHYHGQPSDRRLFLKVTDSIRNSIICNWISMIAINLDTGFVQNSWSENGKGLKDLDGFYENIRPL